MLGDHNAIDEGLLKCRARFSFHIYNKDRPTNINYKLRFWQIQALGIALNMYIAYTHVKVEFLGDDFKVKFLGSTYEDMLLLSQIECEYEKKTPLLCMQYTHRSMKP